MNVNFITSLYEYYNEIVYILLFINIILRLHMEQIGVNPIFLHQLTVRAVFHNFTGAEHHNPVAELRA